MYVQKRPIDACGGEIMYLDMIPDELWAHSNVYLDLLDLVGTKGRLHPVAKLLLLVTGEGIVRGRYFVLDVNLGGRSVKGGT